MVQYCDSKVLEKNWFHWLLSSSVPDLEYYRQIGLLWTKAIGYDGQKSITINPRDPKRSHCLALAVPIYFDSENGNIPSHGTAFVNGEPLQVILPSKDDVLTLLSDSWLHRLETPFVQIIEVIPKLKTDGYVCELPTEQTWHAMLDDINKMCFGIATKFKQPTEEEQADLANEALLQVTKKLAAYKLVYTPGFAPVFNLLTTTIHRCMFSIMNRRKTQRQRLQKFVDDMQAEASRRRMRIKAH